MKYTYNDLLSIVIYKQNGQAMKMILSFKLAFHLNFEELPSCKLGTK